MSKGSVNEQPARNNDFLIATKLNRQGALRSEPAIDVRVDLGLMTVKEKIIVRKRSADYLVSKPAAGNFLDKQGGEAGVSPR